MKFLALQCFSCRETQVKQAKKTSNKWSCSICNEKQSVRKVFYFSEAAKDVRNFVQQANLARGLREEALSNGSSPGHADESVVDIHNATQEFANDKQRSEPSRWERFLSKDDFSDEEEATQPDGPKFVTSIPDVKPRNSRCRGFTLTEVVPKRGGSSAQKRSRSTTEGARELMDVDLHSAYSRQKYSGASDNKCIVRNGEKADLSPCPFSPRPVSSHCGGTSKKGYAVPKICSLEETKASNTEKPQHQTSRWSKYLELNDD